MKKRNDALSRCIRDAKDMADIFSNDPVMSDEIYFAAFVSRLFVNYYKDHKKNYRALDEIMRMVRDVIWIEIFDNDDGKKKRKKS